MHQTPSKKIEIQQFSSLRKSIQQKLRSKKHKISQQDNIYKEQQTLSPKNIFLQNKCYENKFKPSQNAKFFDSNMVPEKIQINQQLILSKQSVKNPGFYGYQEWKQIHQLVLPRVKSDIYKTLWKVIRIINYGQVLIPSGLVFQILSQFSAKRQKSLMQILESFLKMNKVNQSVRSFRQLKFYPSLEVLQSQYIESIYKDSRQISLKQSHKFFSNTKSNTQVFDRIYIDAKVRQEKRNQHLFQGLLTQSDQKQCVFRPQINNFSSLKLFQDDLIRPQRICHHQEKWKSKDQEQETLILSKNFRTGQFDRSILEPSNMQQIPGVREHINRRQYSLMQKQKIQRFKSKPTGVFRHN